MKYDLKNESESKLIYETTIKDFSLIGRLETGAFKIINGILYCNNDCIKLRYDVINRSDVHTYGENDVFDYYNSIFDLQPGERVKQGTPLSSRTYHKLAYVIENK